MRKRAVFCRGESPRNSDRWEYGAGQDGDGGDGRTPVELDKVEGQVIKPPFLSHSLEPFQLSTRSLYQDRLGASTGNWKR